MKVTGVYSMAAALTVSALAWQALADGELVKFPESYAEGVHYATVT